MKAAWSPSIAAATRSWSIPSPLLRADLARVGTNGHPRLSDVHSSRAAERLQGGVTP